MPARWEMRWSWNPVIWRHETCNGRSTPNQISSTGVYHLPMWKGRHTHSKWLHWLVYGTYRDPFKSPFPKAWKSSDESCGAGEAATLGTGLATWRSRFEDWLRLIRLGWMGSSLVSFVPGISIHFNTAKTCGDRGKSSKTDRSWAETRSAWKDLLLKLGNQIKQFIPDSRIFGPVRLENKAQYES